MQLTSLLLLALPLATGFLASVAVPSPTASTAARASSLVMKGKGSRGMPGKGATAPGTGGGFTKNSKQKMQQRDFQRSEWTLVAEKGELSDEVGSTMTAEAGQDPRTSQNYAWALIRGEPYTDRQGEETSVYATDGACVACSFPMSKAVITKEDGVDLLDCKTCGSQWNLDDGRVFKWLPGEGLGQMAMKAINKDKQPTNINLLKTRVSQSGRVYVRLPDGTLKITKTAADRASELSGQSPLEAVAEAQKKAKELNKVGGLEKL